MADTASTVVGLYNDTDTAERVIDDLTNSGFARSAIELKREGDASGLRDEFIDEGVSRDDADYYLERLQSGGVLVSVRADAGDTDKAVDIMNRYADEGGYESRNALEGESRTNRSAQTSSGDETLEVMEERLRVGKREVQRGGVRVRSRIVTEEASEDVTLRDETVHVDRRPVDRPISRADGDVFQERTVEMTERDEEAVVNKEARVVEEVVIGKTVEDRHETVRDTVRRTTVEVEKIGTDDRQDNITDDVTPKRR